MKINLNKFRYYNCDDCSGCRSCSLPQDLQGCGYWREFFRNQTKCYEGQTNWGIAYNPPKVIKNKINKMIVDWNRDGEVLIEVSDTANPNAAWVLSMEEYWAWQNYPCKESAELVLKGVEND